MVDREQLVGRKPIVLAFYRQKRIETLGSFHLLARYEWRNHGRGQTRNEIRLQDYQIGPVRCLYWVRVCHHVELTCDVLSDR